MARATSLFAALAVATAAVAAPAFAGSHRDAVYAACVNEGGGAQPCTCLADRYAAELSDTDLAFYARMLGHSGDAQAMAQVMRELGLTPAEVGAIVRRQAAVDRRARADCGLE